MRHGDKIKNLGRTMAHRAALLSNLTCQLIEHKRIITTVAKAKSLRVYAEPLINRAKNDSMHNRRIVFSHLQDKEAIKELFGVISDKIANRPGGYTRIIKLPFRAGDAADMAMIELVDFNELYKKDSEEKEGKKTRRSRRSAGGGKPTATAAAAETVDTTVEEPVAHVAEEPIEHVAEEPIEHVAETPVEHVVETPEASVAEATATTPEATGTEETNA